MFRQDILDRFLSKPRHFQLYVTWDAYQRDGGIAGGCYDPSSQSIKLVLNRIFEGFYQRMPGTAPFLHEFGHMLDAFDVSTGDMFHSKGFLPGLNYEDGEVFIPEARQFFIEGKEIEIERFEAQAHKVNSQLPIPIGNPYVFQNDSEFIAGYLEMFFRNPNYFKKMNPALYQGFSLLLKQDPVQYWLEDFDFYVRENRKAYQSQSKFEHILTVPVS
jgi:Mlc titration factor MtfA (ptsG expression regulator)